MSLSIPQSGETTRHELTRKPGSVEIVRQKRITFKELLDNYPKTQTPCEIVIEGEGEPIPTYENQCAIRMGVCLTNAGVKIKKSDGLTFCDPWHKKIEGHPRHTIRAQELADWLDVVSKDVVHTLLILRSAVDNSKPYAAFGYCSN